VSDVCPRQYLTGTEAIAATIAMIAMTVTVGDKRRRKEAVASGSNTH
jgi:hypothetical protein